MKVSQQVDAGRLSGSWVKYDGTIDLEFGKDEVTFQADETQLRSLVTRLSKRIAEIEEERAKAQIENEDE
jgi:hypothetical protein